MQENLDDNRVMMFSSVHLYQDARIFFKEAHTLAKKYKVDFFAIGSTTKEISMPNLNVNLLPKQSRFKRFKTILQLKKEIRRSTAKFYHFHDPELLILVSFIRKEKKDAVIIYDMHENFPEAIKTKDWIPKKIRPILSSFIQKKEKKYLQKLDGLIFAEESYGKNYKDIKVKKIDIYNYPIFVNKQHKKIINKIPKLIYIGRIAEVRGALQMLEVVRQLKEDGMPVELELIGSIEDTLLEKINHFITEYKLQEEIKIIKYVDYSNIWDYYVNSDIGLCLLHPIPNYLESFATKIFEYMAAQIPMIVSDFPSWKSLLDENECGMVVNPLDIDEIKSQICILMNPLERNRLGKNGRFKYEQKYNWDVEGKKLLDFYNILK
ncbi:glycosyltransferase family 4 protein [Listeria weihenstephanensis]|uniref:Glycosyltransferase family 4 protein n=1 Tax=Listeria weihenstephanensis TaxID=1006155 RepID=A0A841ZC67_9LIST|nr:glycosyltransferase family 4 protein [Listeria weihenstephanensis]MBC1501873.1 glycosyltransferase family 4 protein [Listeria weihenstephanensis]